MTTKPCTKCHRDLPLTEYYRAAHTESLQSRCKACQKAYARQWHKDNHTRRLAHQAKYHAKIRANPPMLRFRRTDIEALLRGTDNEDAITRIKLILKSPDVIPPASP